ncbi:isochorismatase family protein [Thermodesulfatator atlanticus]|uniref:isochorismatase family protein n=1 Tax=Thermodesulfatator atlanticus TaxID=501497 RepID=UPI0003B3B807|nr:isochorismatase family protein [Thermodesulfatator atlanticus]
MEKTFLEASRSFLMVIDPQEKLMAVINEAQRVIKNISLLTHLARTFNLPIIPTTQYAKGLGPYVPELAPLFEGLTFYDKVEFSALKNKEIMEAVDSLRPARDTIILCGVETHICVYQTALSSLLEDLRVVVAADATSSRTPQNMQYGLAYLRQLGVQVVSTEMIIYEFLEKAGTPEFKAMLPHLK